MNTEFEKKLRGILARYNPHTEAYDALNEDEAVAQISHLIDTEIVKADEEPDPTATRGWIWADARNSLRHEQRLRLKGGSDEQTI